jgi:hypothetical protein
VVLTISLGALPGYYAVPKQPFRKALAHIDTHRQSEDQRVGLTLGGKAARFYDARVQLIQTREQLDEYLASAQSPTWFLYTFENQLRQEQPALHDWLKKTTHHCASFPATIGDGGVHVYRWMPSGSGQ